MKVDKRVYCHISDVDNSIFYVGAGGYYRPTRKAQRTSAWKDIADKGYSVRILKDNLSQEDALELENLIIETIGYDNLTNTGAGRNTSWNKGLSYEKDTRNKISLNSAMAKKVIDLGTGIVYRSLTQYCKENNVSYSRTHKILKGHQKGNVNVKYK